ncbi:peroxisomal sarcosine oxidase-like [Saccoglossus kowalevskii]
MAQHSQDPVRYFEYIVVGCGGIGSGTVYWLSKRVGKAVLGLERFTLGHERGGSQDHARIIRVDYHDDDYTPLVRDSYTTIQDVERESGLKLIHITGRLMMVNKDDPRSEIVAAYEDAMTKANLNYEIINSTEIQRRFPQFCFGIQCCWSIHKGQWFGGCCDDQRCTYTTSTT